MPVPTLLSELSQTAGSNSPPGTESLTTADDYLRTYAGFIATLRDGKGHSAEVDLASAATCDIGGQNSLFVRITGTTTITSFGTTYNGPRFVRFAGALTLTHNATTLILPGAANITTAAGDTCIATPISGGWVVGNYQSAADSGLLASSSDVQTGTSTTKAVTPSALRSGLIVSGTATASTSGTSIDYTGIPSWVKRITMSWSAVSTSGTSNPLIQIGDSGGIEASGYAGSSSFVDTGPSIASSNYTTGFGIRAGLAANVMHGSIVLTLLDAATNTWAMAANIGFSNSTGNTVASGSKNLSATLDRIRLTTAGGTDTFDGGLVNIIYE